ncbi:MAG: TspO/MBR family protein [Christensenellales bacterium]|nr:TspO/MBR family protein [Christensenellales bacterium]
MKIDKKRLIICLAIPLVVGGAAGLLTMNSMEAFEALNQPPLSPPGWLFPVVWTVLYVLMGIASYLVSVSDAPHEEKARALWTYGIQLAFNFLWPIAFFNLKWYLFAFLWLVILWILILITALRFGRIRKPAGYLLVPYLLWVAFAGYLNLGIYLLNP